MQPKGSLLEVIFDLILIQKKSQVYFHQIWVFTDDKLVDLPEKVNKVYRQATIGTFTDSLIFS